MNTFSVEEFVFIHVKSMHDRVMLQQQIEKWLLSWTFNVNEFLIKLPNFIGENEGVIIQNNFESFRSEKRSIESTFVLYITFVASSTSVDCWLPP